MSGDAFIRTRGFNVRAFGPKAPDHPSIGDLCPACSLPFDVGQYTALIALGPGNSAEERWKCREGRPYNAVALEVHYVCATGKVEPDDRP